MKAHQKASPSLRHTLCTCQVAKTWMRCVLFLNTKNYTANAQPLDRATAGSDLLEALRSVVFLYPQLELPQSCKQTPMLDQLNGCQSSQLEKRRDNMKDNPTAPLLGLDRSVYMPA